MPTFIDEYLRHTEIYESASSLWRWSSYITIAAILKDRVFLRLGDRLLYPNLYVLVLAESSGHRKGPPVDLSETLVTKLNNTKVISGRASVQAVLDELARTETDKTTGKVIKSSSAIFYASELSAGIVNDTEGLKILTDIYDYKTNPYKSRLRTGPSFNLERIVLNSFWASNQDMLRDFFSVSEIKGGLLARTCLVVPNEFRKSNSLLRTNPDERKESLMRTFDRLKEINGLNGTFCIGDDALEEYEQWYNPFRDQYTRKREATGRIGRVHTDVLKLSIILAANEMRTVVCRRDIEQAIEQCLSQIPNYGMFTMSHSKTDTGQIGGLILATLLEAKDYKLSRKDLVRELWQSIGDPDSLDKTISLLEQASLITQDHNRQTGEMMLVLTSQFLAKMKGPSV